MARAPEEIGQDAWEQVALLNALLSELIEKMAVGDSSQTWAKIMAFVKQPLPASDC
jgi:hypothetical protein